VSHGAQRVRFSIDERSDQRLEQRAAQAAARWNSAWSRGRHRDACPALGAGARRIDQAGRTAEHHHATATRLQPARRADHVLHRPDVLTVDPSFDGLRQPNAPIQRLWTGALWSEGPAWSSVGRFLVWSDIPNNRQLRWSEDDGHVSVFRMPSNNSNGNTFDYQGRQLSCEHLIAARRALRTRRLGERAGLDLQQQAAQLAERRGAASRRQLLGSPTRPTARNSTKARSMRRAARPTRRGA